MRSFDLVSLVTEVNIILIGIHFSNYELLQVANKCNSIKYPLFKSFICYTLIPSTLCFQGLVAFELKW